MALIVGLVVAALAIIGVAAFFLTRSDDSSSSPDDTDVLTEATEPVDATSDETDVPVTDAPERTDAPEPTGAPETTEAPNETDAPERTDAPESTAAGSVPPPDEEPDDLGDDPQLDELAQRCFDGDMEACDDLYFESDVGSSYELYGDTCAGRQPAGTRLRCVTTFPD